MQLEGPFLGNESVACGLVRKHELRTRYRVLHPNVYVARETALTFRQRAEAAGCGPDVKQWSAGSRRRGMHGRSGLRTRRRSNWCGETRVHREVSVRVEELASLGWTIVRVAAESAPTTSSVVFAAPGRHAPPRVCAEIAKWSEAMI